MTARLGNRGGGWYTVANRHAGRGDSSAPRRWERRQMKELRQIIVVPDSFKGGLSAIRFCEIAERAIHGVYPSARVVPIPVADGGEGTVDAFLAACGGKKLHALVKGPFFEDMESFYGLLPDGTAVIETAACAGLPLVRGREDPLAATTYGVGQLIRRAVEGGCSSVVLAMGGSATNDAGCGMASALGVRFYGAAGTEFVPTGGTLTDIARIDTSDMLKPGVPVTAMCDVDNPLYGEEGAAFVFAPQKGADGRAVLRLDAGLRHFAELIESALSLEVSALKGGGAAGGLGASAVCFLNARLKMGIDVLLDAADFDVRLRDTDLVLTGEGKLDAQSLRGKVVLGVAKRAKEQNIPVLAVVGDIGDDIGAAYDMGITGIFSINRVAVPLNEAIPRSESDLYLTVYNLMRCIHGL